MFGAGSRRSAAIRHGHSAGSQRGALDPSAHPDALSLCISGCDRLAARADRRGLYAERVTSTDPDPSPEPDGSPHGPHRSRSSRRARVIAATIAGIVLLSAGGYTAACALAPLPAPTLEYEGGAERTVTADEAPALAAVRAGAIGVGSEGSGSGNDATAVGWLDGEQVWANTDEAMPIASITKLVTALVALERQPIEGDGPVHVWTEADRQRQDDYLAVDGVAFPIPVGTEVTVKQMLTLAILPSANDFASAYAYSVFGDNDAFVAAVDDWKQRHGITSLVLAEPSGMDEANVASPADVLRIVRLALQQPVLAELIATPRAELPWGIGVVESTNPLFSRIPDVRGAKTGRTDVAGYNLAAAQGAVAGERPVVKLSVVLGRETPQGRITSSIGALTALDAAPQDLEVIAEGERIGSAVTVDGRRVPLVASADKSVVLLPGEKASRIAELSPVRAGEAGRTAGAVRIESPDGELEVPVLVGESFEEPDLLWRLTHPGRLFG